MEISEKKSAGNQNSGDMKKINYIFVVVTVAVVAIALIVGFMAYRHNQEINYSISSVVDEINEIAAKSYGNTIKYPSREGGDWLFAPDGRYDQIKDNKKFAQALIAAMQERCTTEKDEATVYYPDGIGGVYRMAAVLEYLDYENEQVKACVDELTAQALAAANESDFDKETYIYRRLLPFSSLTYYTGAQEQLQTADIEAAYNAKWQEVKKGLEDNIDLASNKDAFANFLKSVYEIVNVSPINVGESADSGMASAVNAVYIPQSALDLNKMLPYNELVAVLQQYGEPAIFRNGQGGYYDGRNDKGTKYGDFRVHFVSGKARRTGQEDAFTEQYMREHYDHPDKTYTYFREEKVSALPPFFNDTKQVFVFDSSVYALTDYAVYFGDDMLPYDYETAKEAEFKHITVSEENYVNNILEQQFSRYLSGLADFNMTYQYDVENSLVTVYMTALPGTTENLKTNELGLVPVNSQGSYAKWTDLVELWSDMTEAAHDELGNLRNIGVALILISDVNPDAGLLSILNGEVVQDNSAEPPEAAPAAEQQNEESEAEEQQEESEN